MLMPRVLSRASRTVGARSLLLAPKQWQSSMFPNQLANSEGSLLQSPPLNPSIFQQRGFSYRFPFVDAYLQKAKNDKSVIEKKKIWSRRSTILPEFVNCVVRIHNGKTFVRKKITESNVGHKFGEFALTRKRRFLRSSTVGSGKKKGKK